MQIDEELWNKFGPFSSTLDIDETDDIDKTWERLAEKINEPVEKVKEAI